MRTTPDGWFSVYDYITQHVPEQKPQTVWTRICAEYPELKGYSEPIQFIMRAASGNKTPTRTPCLHENALVLLERAVSRLSEPAPKSKAKPKLQLAQSPEEIHPSQPPFAVIAGISFENTAALERYLKGMLRDTPAGTYLTGHHFLFMVDLLSKHHLAKRSLINGLYGIKVVQKPGHGYKNFSLHIPTDKFQTISIVNYLAPAATPLFRVNILQRQVAS